MNSHFINCIGTIIMTPANTTVVQKTGESNANPKASATMGTDVITIKAAMVPDSTQILTDDIP